MEAVTIKPMLPEYWAKVKQIYESGIATGDVTFETSAPSWNKWNDGCLQFARFVAFLNNEVVGWSALSPVSNRCVYGDVAAEVSVYVAANFQGKEIGNQHQI